MRWRLRGAAFWPFAVLALAYLLTAVRVAGIAALRDPSLLYWHDWQDQSLYVRSATALAGLNLAPDQHYYPLLYPLLGMPFLRLWPSQPFFLADFACYLLAFGGFRSVARTFGVPVWGAALLFGATTLAQFGIAKLWIEPWTTTPAAACLWLALGAMAALWTADDPRVRRRAAIVLGVALGLLPFARPGDAVIGAMIAAAAAVPLWRERAALLHAVAAFGAAFGLLGALYLAIYGLHPSPYMLYSAQYGFNFGWLGWKAYVLLVDPRAWFGEGMGLLEFAPWLLLGGAGLIAACLWSPFARRPVALTLAAAGTVYTVLMLAYVDLLPTGLWRFNNLHYFKWLFPLFGLFAVRFAADAWRRPRILAAAIPVLLALAIRVEPVRVGDDVPARMVVFPAPLGATWVPTYFATAWLADARGEQRNAFDYHQMLVAGRVRAVALRRPFAGRERWLGDEHVRAQLAGTETGGYAPLYLTGPWPKTPLARYGLRVTLGLPHWFRGDGGA